MYALQRAQRAAKAAGAARNPLLIISTAKDSYVRDLTQQKKAEMAEKAQHVLSEFETFCASHKFKVMHSRSITRQHILDFHTHLRKKGNSERTIHDKHQRVKAWLRFCSVDTSFMPPAPKYEETLPTIYEKKQVDDIRAAADDEMRIAIDLCWMLGLREREATHAEWDDIDWQHSVFRVQGKTRQGYTFAVKDKEQRELSIPAILLQRLKEWRKSHENTRLILSGDRDRPEGHLLRKLKALARNNGLNCGKCAGCQREGSLAECEEWSLHRFRRTFCTSLLRGDVDLATAQRLMGHSDLASTLRYMRPAATAAIQDKMNAIFGDQPATTGKKQRTR
jgi:integrase